MTEHTPTNTPVPSENTVAAEATQLLINTALSEENNDANIELDIEPVVFLPVMLKWMEKHTSEATYRSVCQSLSDGIQPMEAFGQGILNEAVIEVCATAIEQNPLTESELQQTETKND